MSPDLKLVEENLDSNSTSLERQKSRFGIADLLQEETSIYHTVLFSSIHLGRVTDLIGAFLGRHYKNRVFHEYKLRTVLHLGLVESYIAQDMEQVAEFKQPVVVECGIDSLRLVVGIHFFLGSHDTIHVEQLTERLIKSTPIGIFEEILLQIYAQCDQMTLKYHSKSRRFEIDTCISNEGFGWSKGPENRQIDLILYQEDQLIAPAPSQYYVDLGDLKFLKFTSREVSEVQRTPSPSGDFFKVKKSSEESIFSKIFGSSSVTDDHKEIVRGHGENPEPTLIASVSDIPFNEDIFKIDYMDPKNTDLMTEIESKRSDQMIEKARQEITSRDLLKDSKAKKWLDGLFAALISDKMRLKFLAKELNQSMMAKEVNWKSQIATLTNQLEELKKQLVQQKDKAEENLEELNTSLQKKIKPLEQAAPQAHHTREEFTILKEKYDVNLQKLEDFKKTNRRLMGRLSLMTADPGLSSDESSTKKKLEAAMKLLTNQRKESANMKLQIESLTQQQSSLQAEIARLKSK